MIAKLIVLAAIFAGALPISATPQNVQVAQDDGGGDLNPQPLPPIAEEQFA